MVPLFQRDHFRFLMDLYPGLTRLRFLDQLLQTGLRSRGGVSVNQILRTSLIELFRGNAILFLGIIQFSFGNGRSDPTDG